MQNLIQTLVSGIAPATRSRATPQALVLDTLCLLLDILTPKLRPVSARLGGAAWGGGLPALSAPVLPPPTGEHSAVQCPREAAAGQPGGHHACLQPHLPPGAHA